jgi:hypothetical protein
MPLSVAGKEPFIGQAISYPVTAGLLASPLFPWLEQEGLASCSDATTRSCQCGRPSNGDKRRLC